ncbi:hypothetical protein [Streptomyces endophyticus]|uniref:Uncharacterized protein n=1 Tax=Streptomyces endophyticus TaxID=714166 RepID=A0ABU6EZD4_9ACTN|nr:hypothetical protein [Streptomyces endophyticus]MEB8336979.1 hypothetical protein [Streptomyces endophyticus]
MVAADAFLAAAALLVGITVNEPRRLLHVLIIEPDRRIDVTTWCIGRRLYQAVTPIKPSPNVETDLRDEYPAPRARLRPALRESP